MRHQQTSQLYFFSKVLLVFTLLLSQTSSLSLSWKTKRSSATTTTTRSKLTMSNSNSFSPTRTSIKCDATMMMMMGSASTTSNGRNCFSSSYQLFRRGTLLSRMNLSASRKEEEEEKTTEDKGNTDDTGLKNAIMMGTTLFLKFFVVMIVKFVKDVTIFPTIYMMKFIKRLISTVKKRPNNSSEEDLDLTRVRFFFQPFL